MIGRRWTEADSSRFDCYGTSISTAKALPRAACSVSRSGDPARLLVRQEPLALAQAQRLELHALHPPWRRCAAAPRAPLGAPYGDAKAGGARGGLDSAGGGGGAVAGQELL